MGSIVAAIAFVAAIIYARSRLGYFRFSNVLRRVVGLCFVSFPVVGILVTIVGIVWPGAFDAEVTSSSQLVGLVMFFAPFVAVGIWVLRSPTYRPDLGDTMRLVSTDPWSEELARRQNRSWWTGDPKTIPNESVATPPRTIQR